MCACRGGRPPGSPELSRSLIRSRSHGNGSRVPLPRSDSSIMACWERGAGILSEQWQCDGQRTRTIHFPVGNVCMPRPADARPFHVRSHGSGSGERHCSSRMVPMGFRSGALASLVSNGSAAVYKTLRRTSSVRCGHAEAGGRRAHLTSAVWQSKHEVA